ncbi:MULTISPECIES: tRNA preQ1(34) S-adenosylmethionine ribosyltransferase-isomerase QueA [unclassified Oceanispirochaeta]|uniref:tRNA preQ1(34) S-adenosylmethionine ribosyltransferase-isomerase QueA n=1 Tax=unclassified Oceanispirochaeta TaxID=2635722 RepID=UPI000E08F892|nr:MULTISPECIES: tRNA preQ1(34) S-adenosylmethionine ribosyltransferase-isomerase QueA [unclassified Oceanispirochaeta]MBF9015161.1 tRNA preQ1(34) S-adenosylmethionine ribosyltransferase-isomerase QueA [Oceanispirochaeta sp. M2]NPD71619.1 tRNA preQ1(34) S-adenosylmethionine ribosyltransferase-isomerase QueA [Oceanispirochaeta sp. M1]RDG33186.1 tRNA preQ1(34) S-adenosylmethionine ribosyltransferase-isomerase QueA [Oceanispirochaeta sp. M1]
MKIREFSFNLPPEQIAQHPPEERGTAKLMVMDRENGQVSHKNMQDFPDLIEPGTLVIFNNSRVRKARVFAFSEHGGKVEFFFLKSLEENLWLCMVSKAKKQKTGKKFSFPGDLKGVIEEEVSSNHRKVRFSAPVDDDYLDIHGHIPLPPYIKREDSKDDSERYQSVFSKETGSVAAPTASLHFTDEILGRLKERGIETAFITLHVGLGTFEPVRTESILDHEMHEEQFSISDETADKVEKAVREGRPVLAVGTTSVRTLESAWVDGKLQRGENSTDIFIYPGYEFKVVNRMFTNFHTPESTLLVLVSAFAGKDHIDAAYKEAVEKGYMFFSYGDAMLMK